MRHIILVMTLMFSCEAAHTSSSTTDITGNVWAELTTSNEDCPSPPVEDELFQKAIASMRESNKRKFFSWEQRARGARGGLTTVSFISSDGDTYTICDNMGQLLIISERGNRRHVMVTYSSRSHCAHYGTTEEYAINDKSIKKSEVMSWSDSSIPDTGLEHHALWQKRYRQALEALARVVEQ